MQRRSRFWIGGLVVLGLGGLLWAWLRPTAPPGIEIAELDAFLTEAAHRAKRANDPAVLRTLLADAATVEAGHHTALARIAGFEANIYGESFADRDAQCQWLETALLHLSHQEAEVVAADMRLGLLQATTALSSNDRAAAVAALARVLAYPVETKPLTQSPLAAMLKQLHRDAAAQAMPLLDEQSVGEFTLAPFVLSELVAAWPQQAKLLRAYRGTRAEQVDRLRVYRLLRALAAEEPTMAAPSARLWPHVLRE